MSVYIVAEAGVNHNGSLEMAKELARVAKECGADAVKYQTAVPELVISKFAQKAEYQKKTTGEQESQLEMVRRLHFDFAAHKELKEYCTNSPVLSSYKWPRIYNIVDSLPHTATDKIMHRALRKQK